MADPYPLYVPPDARRPFHTESLLRRFAQMAQWDQSSQLLELSSGLGGMALARALTCQLVVVESDAAVLEQARERARAAQLTDLVTFIAGDPLDLDFDEGQFAGIFALGTVLGPVAALARKARPLLGPRGRLGLTTVVKVGLRPAPEVVAAWEKRLGHPLLTPRDSLLALETEGFEPELAETLGTTELEEHHAECERALKKLSARPPGAAELEAELRLHREHRGAAGVTLAFVSGRRKEPGEKPPLARDAG